MAHTCIPDIKNSFPPGIKILDRHGLYPSNWKGTGAILAVNGNLFRKICQQEDFYPHIESRNKNATGLSPPRKNKRATLFHCLSMTCLFMWKSLVHQRKLLQVKQLSVTTVQAWYSYENTHLNDKVKPIQNNRSRCSSMAHPAVLLKHSKVLSLTGSHSQKGLKFSKFSLT